MRGGTAWRLAWLFHMRELDGRTDVGASETYLNTGTWNAKDRDIGVCVPDGRQCSSCVSVKIWLYRRTVPANSLVRFP